MKWKILVFTLFLLLINSYLSFAQDRDEYIVGDDEKLEMVVHVLGEVQRPGEYRVGDKTNVLELISKAGGPTSFSSMGSVKITRIADLSAHSNGTSVSNSSEIIKVNLEKYLNSKTSKQLPVLMPGDVVYVPRNGWFRWQTVFRVIRDLSVVASVAFLAIRTANGN